MLVLVRPVAQGQSSGAVSPRSGAGVGDTSIFAPLNNVPPPNTVRSASGAPGAQYWQNQTDYEIWATLDTASGTLHGRLTLHYINHSPDTLHYLWLQTDQDALRPNTLRSFLSPNTGSTRHVHDASSMLEEVTQRIAGHQRALALHAQESVTRVDLAQPLAPGHAVVLTMTWHVRLRHGAPYQVDDWYPRPCVYDDVLGWNIEQWLPHGDTYLEYGDATLHLTVPASYLVAATGVLVNPETVLTATERTRLAQAAASMTVVHVVTAAELAKQTARPTQRGTLTWTFHANNVHDLAWGAAPDYQWDATHWHHTIIQTFYRPSQAAVWVVSADQLRTSLDEYSTRLTPYPYPTFSAVEGPIQASNHPMLSFDGDDPDSTTLYLNLTSSVNQSWFPALVGSNGRVHIWQDEGFALYITPFGMARRYPAHGSVSVQVNQQRQVLEGMGALSCPVPVDIVAGRLTEQEEAFCQFVKPAVALHLLREEILDSATFDEAMRTYVKQWTYKHPTPDDFYRTIENVAGRRLDWFWREWFLETPHFDQAIDSVATRMHGDTMNVAVRYGNHARGVLPLLVRFTFSDGTTQDMKYPAEVWSLNSVQYVRRYQFVGKTVTRIELDPDNRLVEFDRTNNRWIAPAQVSAQVSAPADSAADKEALMEQLEQYLQHEQYNAAEAFLARIDSLHLVSREVRLSLHHKAAGGKAFDPGDSLMIRTEDTQTRLQLAESEQMLRVLSEPPVVLDSVSYREEEDIWENIFRAMQYLHPDSLSVVVARAEASLARYRALNKHTKQDWHWMLWNREDLPQTTWAHFTAAQRDSATNWHPPYYRIRGVWAAPQLHADVWFPPLGRPAHDTVRPMRGKVNLICMAAEPTNSYNTQEDVWGARLQAATIRYWLEKYGPQNLEVTIVWPMGAHYHVLSGPQPPSDTIYQLSDTMTRRFPSPEAAAAWYIQGYEHLPVAVAIQRPSLHQIPGSDTTVERLQFNDFWTHDPQLVRKVHDIVHHQDGWGRMSLRPGEEPGTCAIIGRDGTMEHTSIQDDRLVNTNWAMRLLFEGPGAPPRPAKQ